MSNSDDYLHCPPTDLRGYHPTDYVEVTYAVSYRYNGGGISIRDKWYAGFKVPAPLINPGYVLVGIGVGLQLNACPPYATGVLKPKSRLRQDEPYMDLDGVWKRHNGPIKEIEVSNGIRRPSGELAETSSD